MKILYLSSIHFFAAVTHPKQRNVCSKWWFGAINGAYFSMRRRKRIMSKLCMQNVDFLRLKWEAGRAHACRANEKRKEGLTKVIYNTRKQTRVEQQIKNDRNGCIVWRFRLLMSSCALCCSENPKCMQFNVKKKTRRARTALWFSFVAALRQAHLSVLVVQCTMCKYTYSFLAQIRVMIQFSLLLSLFRLDRIFRFCSIFTKCVWA